MFSDPIFIVIAAACFLVLGILLVGIGGYGRGGDFNAKHANRIMRYRIYAQLFAIILIIVLVALRRMGYV